MPYFITIVGAVAVMNFYVFFVRGKKTRNVGKRTVAERVETVKRHGDLVRKLDREQAYAAKRVELQNKTFELYEQVRREAAEREDL